VHSLQGDKIDDESELSRGAVHAASVLQQHCCWWYAVRAARGQGMIAHAVHGSVNKRCFMQRVVLLHGRGNLVDNARTGVT
jgi:hypothetical protein